MSAVVKFSIAGMFALHVLVLAYGENLVAGLGLNGIVGLGILEILMFELAVAARRLGARSVRAAVAQARAARAAAAALRTRLMEALRALVDALVPTLRVAARRTAPPLFSPGGRAIAFVALTPRLLAQRPQPARAERAGLL